MDNIIINNARLIKSKNTNRYSVIDILRALTIISMIFYHASWDIIYMFGVRFMDLYSPIGILWQQSICFVLLFYLVFAGHLEIINLKMALVLFFGHL